jgi:hypothetical protein
MKQHGYEFKRGKDFERRLQIWADNDGELDFPLSPSQQCAPPSHQPLTPNPNSTDYITAHNSANHTYRLGHNAYSHLSSDEFRGMMGLKGRGAGHPLTRTGSPQPLPLPAFLAAPEAAVDEMQASVWAQQQGLADAIDWVVRACVCFVLGLRRCI